MCLAPRARKNERRRSWSADTHIHTHECQDLEHQQGELDCFAFCCSQVLVAPTILLFCHFAIYPIVFSALLPCCLVRGLAPKSPPCTRVTCQEGTRTRPHFINTTHISRQRRERAGKKGVNEMKETKWGLKKKQRERAERKITGKKRKKALRTEYLGKGSITRTAQKRSQPPPAGCSLGLRLDMPFENAVLSPFAAFRVLSPF